MPEKSIIDQIKHYQNDIDRCPGDSKRMIRCIERLTVLPVTIAHLEKTGVGRSVNELRKCGGEVGAAANSLVCKWKSMVKDSDSEEESEEEEVVEHSKSSTVHRSPSSNRKKESSQQIKKVQNSDHHKKLSSSHSTQSKKESHSHDKKTSRDSSNHKSSSRSQEKSHRDSSTKSGYGSNTDSKHSHSQKSKPDHISKDHRSSSSRNSETDRNGSSDKDKKIKHDKFKQRKYSTDSVSSDNKLKDSKNRDYKDKHRKESKSSTPRSSNKYDLKRIESSDTSDDDIYKPSSKKQKFSDDDTGYKSKTKHSKTLVKVESSDEKESESESEEESECEEKVHIHSSGNSDSDNNSADNISGNDQEDSARDSEGSDTGREPEENNSEVDNESSEEEEYIPITIKKEKPEKDDKSNNIKEKSYSDNVNSKYSSKSQSKYKLNIKQEKDEGIKIKKEKEEKNRVNSDSQREDEKNRGIRQSQREGERNKLSAHSHREDKYSSDKKPNKERKSTSTLEKSTRENKTDKKVKVKLEKEDDGSIDCVSGASFADALLGLSDTKKKVAKRKPSSPSLSGKTHKPAEKSSSKLNSSKYDRTLSSKTSTPSSSSKINSFKEPDLLSKSIKLEPLDVDLKATLPEITPNYKPLPHYSPPSSPHSKRAKLSQEDALSSIMSTKNQRTKVYSGNKTGYTKVPSLFDLCIQVLQNNIEGLEYTGGVPYDLLKPVLDRATADQLHQLEYYNPYLVEDTDSLWKFHCKKEFRGKEPEEFETWRELYLRSLDERERKLKALKENITQSIAKSTPIRQTKLAYIDSVVKPPRNVARQQMKMGTGKAVKHEIVSKAMVGAASGSPASEAVSVPPPPKTNSSNSQFPIPNFLKKKKAPLMAKALQLIKGNRFKR